MIVFITEPGLTVDEMLARLAACLFGADSNTVPQPPES